MTQRADNESEVTAVDDLADLKFVAYDRDAKPIDVDDRLRAFVLRYARNWKKKRGSLPKGQHPFPNPWDYTFIVDFGNRQPSSDNPAWAPSNTKEA